MADLNEILKQTTQELTETYKPDYEKIEAQKAAEQKALDTERNRQQGILDKNLWNANQQAYITRMQAQRDMPAQLAAQGIRGGATETTLNNLYNNYLNARNTAKASYDDSTGALSSNYNTNLASLGSKYAQMMAQLDSEKRTQALTLAQQKYQQALAEEEAARAAAAAAASRGGSGGGGGTTENTPSYANNDTNYAGGSSSTSGGKVKDIIYVNEWDGKKYVKKKVVYYENGTSKKMSAQ